MKKTLYQTVTVNGVTSVYTSQDNGIFMLLAHAQDVGHIHTLGAESGVLSPTWLQEDPRLLEHLGRLFTIGHTSIFSLTERYDVKIKWDWRDEDESAPTGYQEQAKPAAEESRSEAAEADEPDDVIPASVELPEYDETGFERI